VDPDNQKYLDMKKLLLLVFISLCVSVHGQDKKLQSRFNQLQTIKGTEFVIASMVNYGKLLKTNDSLMIINAKTGQITPVIFSKKVNINKIKQVRIDSMGINYLIVTAQTKKNNKSVFDYQAKLFLISIDGQAVRQLTDDNYFTSDWVVNKQVGSLLITGQTDINKNGKLDSSDKNEILIFDLKTLTRTEKK
jgi:hypothetical protein